MKKYQIALAGTFDVENYGDLMFPAVFDMAMRERGLDFDLTLFSPSRKAPMALNKKRMIYSFRDFEELDRKLHFDALVIGGGALIHYNRFKLLMPNGRNDEYFYNAFCWLPLIYLAVAKFNKNGDKTVRLYSGERQSIKKKNR